MSRAAYILPHAACAMSCAAYILPHTACAMSCAARCMLGMHAGYLGEVEARNPEASRLSFIEPFLDEGYPIEEIGHPRGKRLEGRVGDFGPHVGHLVGVVRW